MVSQLLAKCQGLMHWSKISWLLTKMPMECRSGVNCGVNWVSIAYWLNVDPGSIKVLIDGIDQHLTVDALVTHDPLNELLNELMQQQ